MPILCLFGSLPIRPRCRPLTPKFGGCALLSDLFLDLSRGDPHDAHAIADHVHRAVLTFWSLGHTPIVTRLLSMAKRDGFQTETLPAIPPDPFLRDQLRTVSWLGGSPISCTASPLAIDHNPAVLRAQFDLPNVTASGVGLSGDHGRALRRERGLPKNERLTSGFGGREMPNLNLARHRVVRSPFPSKFSDVLDPLSIVFHHCSNLGLL